MLKYIESLRGDFNFPDMRHHDVEASAYDPNSDSFYIFTKAAKSRVFSFKIGENIKLKKVTELDIPKVSGAAFYKENFYIINLESIYRIKLKDLHANKQAQEFVKAKTWQSEAIAINDMNLVITSEASSGHLAAKIISNLT